MIHFSSRNKDNKGRVEGFVCREKYFLTDKNPDQFLEMFKKFADEGKDGEISRFYYSINKRDYNKTKKKLILELIDKDNASLVNINSLLVSCAMQKECAITKKWLIDFDSRDPFKWVKFRSNLRDLVTIEQVYPTINGFGIVTQRGFDTREFSIGRKFEEYCDVISIHKDGYKLYTHLKKE